MSTGRGSGLKSGPVQRDTKQRQAIRKAFTDADRPLGPTEVLDLAGEHVDGLGQATVYRAIKAFIDEGWLIPVELPGEPARYELADKGHHHHFRCRTCGSVFDLVGCVKGLEKLLPKGFKLEDHEILLYGLCDSCA